jgi:hypothetical protein
MIEDEQPTNDMTKERSGYKVTPKHTRWPKGTSGNPSGKKKTVNSTLKDAFAAKLSEKQFVPDNNGGSKLTLKHRIVRELVERAAGADARALVELIKLSELDPGEPALTQPWQTMHYSDAMAAYGSDAMDEAFYLDHEKKKAAWLKDVQGDHATIKTLIDRELARKVPVKKDGKLRLAPMSDVIVARFLQEVLAGNTTVFKLLLRLVPEKKVKQRWFVDILRPSQAELEWCGPKDRTKWPKTVH